MKINTKLKILACFIVVIGIAVLASLFAQGLLAKFELSKLIYFAIFCFLLLIFYLAASFFIEDRKLLALLSILLTIMLALFSFKKIGLIWSSVSAVILLFYLIKAQHGLHRSLADSLRISFFSFGSKFLHGALNGISIFFIILFLINFYNLYLIGDRIPDIGQIGAAKDLTLGSVVNKILAPQVQALPSFIRDQAMGMINQELPDIISKIAPGFNIGLNDNIVIASVKLVKGLWQKLPYAAKLFLAISTILSIFGLLKLLFHIIIPLVLFIAWLLYELLLAIGFFKIGLVSAEKEKIVL